MNGNVTVWCVTHRRQVLRDDETIYHNTGLDRCDSRWFRVRRERQVGPESALHELRMAERSRVRTGP
jgi:hypothetical protein